MAEIVLGVLLAVALAAAAFLAARYALLKRSLRQADRELGEIVGHLEDNRIVRLPAPDADLEALLGTVNRALAGIRAQAAACARHEAELKAQVEHVSHDLRTPLTSIRGYLALVDDAALDAEAREALGTVRRKAASLERLVAQFYELSRLQGDDVPLELGPVDVGRMLRESVAEQYRLLADRGLDVRLDVPEHAVLARANGEAVERVLANLLHNAGKYAKTALEVSMTGEGAGAAGAGGRVTVEFANDAEGLSESALSRLFQPFFMADASRAQEGSGLGLAIARHLLERMGGSIEASLERREGACWLVLRIELPAA
ncbi:sensor histidine kinase [Gordonibacter urolithinfaciens]|uniref:sensor histidine kinase n=1 Tax=Gordonibacter urolithinfaciens TaxID=1335613 RepID=UPI001F4D4308|nr:HAMP domain-containing sensor histidine kinase [Gordonibacter urolithinfaciens]